MLCTRGFESHPRRWVLYIFSSQELGLPPRLLITIKNTTLKSGLVLFLQQRFPPSPSPFLSLRVKSRNCACFFACDVIIPFKFINPKYSSVVNHALALILKVFFLFRMSHLAI